MKVAAIIVHNKSDSENINQINTVKSLVDEVRVATGEIDDFSNEPVTVISHYTIKGLNIDHEIKFYQIIPFGVTPPPNRDSIDSHKVYYGVGDENKTGTHPRFFNWGLKRGTDFGADIVIYLDNLSQFTSTRAKTALQKFTNDTEFVEATFGKLASLRLLKEVGQLKEDMTFTNAITDLKNRVTQKGFRNG